MQPKLISKRFYKLVELLKTTRLSPGDYNVLLYITYHVTQNRHEINDVRNKLAHQYKASGISGE